MNPNALHQLRQNVDVMVYRSDRNKNNPLVQLLRTPLILERLCVLLLSTAMQPPAGYVKKENSVVFLGDRKALLKLNATCSALNLLFKVTKPQVFLAVDPPAFVSGQMPRHFSEFFDVLRASVVVNNCNQRGVLLRIACVTEAKYRSVYNYGNLQRARPAFTEEQVMTIMSETTGTRNIIYTGSTFLQTTREEYLLKFIDAKEKYGQQEFIQRMNTFAPALYWRLFHNQPFPFVRKTIKKWFRYMGPTFARNSDLVGMIFQEVDAAIGTYFLQKFTDNLDADVFRICIGNLVHTVHEEFIVVRFPELDIRRKRARICQDVSSTNDEALDVVYAITTKRHLTAEQRDLMLTIVNSD